MEDDSKDFKTADTVVNVIVILFLIAYAIEAIVTGEFYLPSRNGAAIRLTGFQMVLMGVAVVFAIINAIYEIKYTYSKHGAKHSQKKIMKFTKVTAWTFFILAIVLNIVNHYSN